MTKLVSLRGAITAENTVESISRAVNALVDRLYFKNGITDADVVNISITLTDDLSAYSAAKALREGGRDVPLFSAVEPKIDGTICGCIRVMITAYSEHEPRNIYLKRARVLRPDIAEHYSIALDGPSGAGKSTVAKLVASRLKIAYLDTGALYRSLGLKCLNENVSTKDGEGVEKCIENVKVCIAFSGGKQQVLLDGVDVSDKIRTPEVSMAASDVSAVPYVRAKLLGLQRDIAAQNNVILDGRDIGTVVLPNAEFKFFLTASAEVRARRRYEELIAKGQTVVYDDVLNDVVTRDHNDSSRAVAPLKCAYDATEINSDGLTAEQVADIIVGAVTEDIS